MNFGVNVTISLMMDSAQKMSTVNIKLGIEVNGRINMAFEKERKKKARNWEFGPIYIEMFVSEKMTIERKRKRKSKSKAFKWCINVIQGYIYCFLIC